MNEAAFRLERSKGVGGSDWGDVLSIEPYGCRRKAWLEKRGVEPDFPRPVTGAMTRGKKLEAVVADEVAEDLGFKLRNVNTVRPNPDLPTWWIGHPDREIVGHPSGPGILEIKTKAPVLFFRIRKAGAPPDAELAQVQHYLAQARRSWGHYRMKEPVSWMDFDATVERDDSLVEEMVRAGEEFWQDVKSAASEGPPRLSPDDGRCHRCPWRITCQGAALYNVSPRSLPGEPEEMDTPELISLLEEYDEVRDIADTAKAHVDSIKGQLMEILGDTPRSVRVSGRPVAVIQAVSNRLDTKALRAAHPDIAAKFSVQKAGAPYVRVWG